MKEYAEWFYKSTQWQQCRDSYYKIAKGLCECCLSEGKITEGIIVHHKKHITPENINNPEITLNYSNLELLCRECHASRHGKRTIPRRYKIDEYGRARAK